MPVDALVDDLIGLNWRALKTLGTAFAKPFQLAQAAWSEDWENRYTPSFRLWFTLVAVLFFFQFFWAADDSALIALYASMMKESGLELPNGVSMLDASRYYARIVFAIVPFSSALCLFAFGLVYRVWGEPVPFVVRIRYVFAVVIPSTSLTIPVYYVLGVSSQAQVGAFVIFSWLLSLPIDAWIAYRGVYLRLNGFARLWRSIVLSLALFVAMMLSAVLSSYLAGAWIAWEQGG